MATVHSTHPPSKYEALTSPRAAQSVADDASEQNSQEHSLFKIKKALIYTAASICIYTLASASTLIWMCQGPCLPHGLRVLQVPQSWKVDQFFSGLALAALFTPAALVIRLMCNDYGRLHPFAIASVKPVRTGDLDQRMEFGVWPLPTLWRYSKWTAIFQAILMFTGAALVPIGTLTVTIASYSPRTLSEAVIGMPIIFLPNSTSKNLLATMGYKRVGKFIPVYDDTDVFLAMVLETSRGTIINQSGMLRSTSAQLGPITTLNFKFETGVQYNSIVTYNWSPNCEMAQDEVPYYFGTSEVGIKFLQFTFPDGSRQDSYMHGDLIAGMFLWNNATERAPNHIPIGGTTYIVTYSKLANSSSTMFHWQTPDITYDNGTWISRVKCTPKFSWQVSSCTFDGRVMENCTSTPGQNTTVLDTVGLDALSNYPTAALWAATVTKDAAIYESPPGDECGSECAGLGPVLRQYCRCRGNC